MEPIKIENMDKQMIAYAIERHYDLAYLKLTVIIILLIIIIFYVTCKFNISSPLKTESTKTAAKPVSVGEDKPEHFSPAASVLIGDIYNSTPGFDNRDSF